MSWLKKADGLEMGKLPGGLPSKPPMGMPGKAPELTGKPPMGGPGFGGPKKEKVTADSVAKNLKELIQTEKVAGKDIKALEAALKSVETFLKDSKEDKGEEKAPKEEKPEPKEIEEKE